ncbi:AAA family ATPase [Glycomyces albidus]|uniref:AAA family ATPase n=1 Tax=Glycomyces albidus TaxID=2656774 RepID=UPI00128FD1FC|nr:AAA family ATPase [Glycomyces albidus]
MRLHEIWIRFYKSFNFDYELKASPKAKPRPWQDSPEGWLPHVKIPIEPDVTAVVGANESGKSHLLDAIKIVLTGEGLRQRDFCRSSALFSVERGSRLFPEVGATFHLDAADRSASEGLAIPLLRNGDLLMLRPAPGVIHVVDADDQPISLAADQVEGLTSLLPVPRELRTDLALPDSVSINALAKGKTKLATRKQRGWIMSLLEGIATVEDVNSKAAAMVDMLGNGDALPEAQRLGMDLLLKVARIEESSFDELRKAIAEEREGLVNGLIQEMNRSIARHLNVSRWWSQDPDFQLRVSPREHELVFTIRDRTGTDYSFSERSRGLQYFLSYYVQLLSQAPADDRPEILLMDEPDAYLSASGQQDLLRVLEHHARPDDSDREDQVIYVTHSPFLINRNAGHRVRVVDKGTRDEGTRVVKDATRNHYEPLRTSLGAFVAETAFIGGDNLFVEGIADQVMLAGMNSRLLRAGRPPSQCLDLNEVTIVPGGASIPYMVYLARGRDQIKPACVVLLDGDSAGQTARKQLRSAGPYKKPIIDEKLVVVLSEWADSADLQVTQGVVIRETEDLVPVQVAVAAGQRYARTFLGLDELEAKKLTEGAVTALLADNDGSLWDALAAAFSQVFGTSISKAGFAKELLAYLAYSEEDRQRPHGVPALDQNFAALLQHLAETLRNAGEREAEARRNQRLTRIIKAFEDDFPEGCIRDRALVLLHSIDAAADDTSAGDLIKAHTASMRRTYKLATSPRENIDDYAQFLVELRRTRYLERLSQQGDPAAQSLGASAKAGSGS